MKKLIPVIAILLATNTYAGNCQRRDQSQCSNSRRSTVAYEQISRAENGTDDVKKVMTMLLSIERRIGVSTTILADLYVSILKSLGGSSNTTKAIDILVETQDLLEDGFSSDGIAEAIQVIASSENDSQDVRKAFDIVKRISMSKRINVTNLAHSYAATLRHLGGSSSTKYAISAMKQMSNFAHLWHFEDMVSSLGSLRRAENDNSDALNNFELVLAASEFCDSMDEPTEDFIRILNSNGGSSSTRDSQQMFKTIYKL